jgi:cellulose biosynthesis protein BcsQ
MRTIGFFNNKGGVGKTTLVYHLAWMYPEIGLHVVALDLDPQASLTAAFLPENRLEHLWLDEAGPQTILGAVQPLIDGSGEPPQPVLESYGSHLALLPGHLGLSLLEGRLAEAWSSPPATPKALRVTASFFRVASDVARERDADLVLLDLGPSLGPLNRAALLACDFVVLPVGADVYSLHGLRTMGTALDEWRRGWQERRGQDAPPDLSLPSGEMRPAGYVILQPPVRLDRPANAHQRWVESIPGAYHREILKEPEGTPVPDPDPYHLATLKRYRSLMPLAQDARKPMFLLKPADGAIGGYSEAVIASYRHFQELAKRIATACGIAVP